MRDHPFIAAGPTSRPAACGREAPSVIACPEEVRMRNRHYRNCTLCEAMCGIVVETQVGSVLRVEGDGADPFSRGYICPKAMALADLHHDPDRLRRPLVRRGERFVASSWEQAFDEVASHLKRVRQSYGE